MLDLDYFNILSKTNKAIIIMAFMGFDVTRDGEILHYKNPSCSVSIKNGYKTYGFRFPSRIFGRMSANVSIHRFQAFKKYGGLIFDSDLQVRHLNNISLDNSWSNIGIGTAKENCQDKTNHSRMRSNKAAVKGKRDKNIERQEKVWSPIYEDRAAGLSYREISQKHGVSKSTLSYHFKEDNDVARGEVRRNNIAAKELAQREKSRYEAQRKDMALRLWQEFCLGDYTSLRDFSRRSSYEKSHVNLSKLWNKYIPDYVKSSRGVALKKSIS